MKVLDSFIKKEGESETSKRQELLMAGHYKDNVWCNFKVMGLINYEVRTTAIHRKNVVVAKLRMSNGRKFIGSE